MFKFLRKHPPKESEERERLKKELFGYRRCMEHGFPNKPSCVAYDPKLNLVAVGTKTGRITVLGTPGVEFYAELKSDIAVNQLFFLPEEARLVCLCSDNTIYLWEINTKGEGSVLEQKKEYVFNVEESRTKGISVCCLTNDNKQLLIGTEVGNIYLLDIETFKLLDQIIYQDVVMQNVPDDFKVNPGPVEAVSVHPTNPDQVLIGYNRGLIVLWDNKESNAKQTYNATQQLESLAWHRNGTEFMSAHIDGSYIVWSTSDSSAPKEAALTPYGPFPCKAISKVQWKTAKADTFIIFSGGMPRASYGDKHTISVMQGSNHVVYDFTSKVIDFFTICRADVNDENDRDEYDEPHTLLVLLEEEMVAIDLDSEGWPTVDLPYLNSVHCSPVTCSQHVSNIPDQLWQKIVDAGDAQKKNCSKRDWPISGGKISVADSATKDILLTGHEDGTVRFWDASGASMGMLYKLSTAAVFNVDIHSPDSNNGDLEEEWPPFKKVGNYDPYSDDPRLGIQKIALCPLSETLVVAGTAGQVIVMQMERDERDQEVSGVTANIVSDRDSFVWKGHEALTTRDGEVKYPAGFQPNSVMQLYPPAACTALAFHSEWQLVAAGTAHGFALFDYAQKKEVTSRCTLNPTDMTGTSDTPISRRKSFKKSLRESFRRLRKRRSERRKAATEDKAKEKEKDKDKDKGKSDEKKEEGEGAEGGASPSGSPSKTSQVASSETRPVERQVEARNPDESMGSMVRCLYFASTYVTDALKSTSSLWVGTNGGHVFIYSLAVPEEKRTETEVTAVLAKEIKLRHKAPVISIGVVDGKSRILPDPLEVQHSRAKAPEGNHHTVVICSEEQLKVFTLPHLKAKWKYKLTALDGSRVRKVAFVDFRSKSDENYSENDIACLSNLGDLSVYSISTLRQQILASALKREDINGISSFTFTKYGQGFFLLSSSEYAHVTLSARYVTEPKCVVELKEGMRPPEPEPEPEPEPAKEEEEAPAENQEPANTEEAKTEEAKTGEGPASQYDAGDIAEALNESTLNDSQANTTMEGEITQDSIQIIETETIQESSSRTIVTTSTTVETSQTVTVGDQTDTTTSAESNSEVSEVTETTTQHTVTSSGDAPTANGIQEEDDSMITKAVEKTEEELTKLKITDEDAALTKKSLEAHADTAETVQTN